MKHGILSGSLLIISLFLTSCQSDSNRQADPNNEEIDSAVFNVSMDMQTEVDSDRSVDEMLNVRDMTATGVDQDLTLDMAVMADATVEDEPWPPGNIDLMGYIRCTEDNPSACYIGHGTCITSLVLNRTESTADGERLRVPLREIEGFTDLEEGEGVCSADCSLDGDEVCPQTYSLGRNINEKPWSCQLVYRGSSAYQRSDIYPHQPLPDYQELQQGIIYASICRPPLGRSIHFSADFCEVCSTNLGSECLPNSLCLSQFPFADETRQNSGHCLAPCLAQDECPLGFQCRQINDDELAINNSNLDLEQNQFCFPQLGTCGNCLDRDDDQRGIGLCTAEGSSAEDCDDKQASHYFDLEDMSHPFPRICGPLNDANCNGLADDTEQVGVLDEQSELIYGAQHCGACFNTCEGEFGSNESSAVARCIPEEETEDQTSYCGIGCQPNRANCDGLEENGCEVDQNLPQYRYLPDCDEDGAPALMADYFSCDGSLLVDVDGRLCPTVPAFVETNGVWEAALKDCDDANELRHPHHLEVCDGIDNNCDSENLVDEGILNEGTTCNISELYGNCAIGVYRCITETGIQTDLTCVQTNFATTEICDGANDEDCDGEVDNRTDSNLPVLVSADLNLNNVYIGSVCDPSELPTQEDRPISTCVRDATWQCDPNGVTECILASPQAGIDDLFDGDDTDCDGFEGTLANSLIVDSNDENSLASDISGDGTFERPYKTLRNALDIYESRKGTQTPVKQIVLKSGEYTLTRNLEISAQYPLSIMGQGVADTTIMISPTLISQGSPHTISIQGPFAESEPVGFRDLRLEVAEFVEGAADDYSMFNCHSCEWVIFKSVHFKLPKGLKGVDGRSGTEIRLEHEPNSTEQDLNGLPSFLPRSVLTLTDLNNGLELYKVPEYKYCKFFEPEEETYVLLGGRGGDGTPPPPRISVYSDDVIRFDITNNYSNFSPSIFSTQGKQAQHVKLPFHFVIEEAKPGNAFHGESCEFFQDRQSITSDYLCDAGVHGENGEDALPPEQTINESSARGKNGFFGFSGAGGGGSLGASFLKCNYEVILPPYDCASNTMWLHHGAAGSSGATGGCGGHGGEGGQPGQTLTIMNIVEGSLPQLQSVVFDLSGGGDGGTGGAGEKGGSGGDNFSNQEISWVTQVGGITFPLLGGTTIPSATSSPTLTALEVNHRDRSGRGGKGGHGSGGGGGNGGKGGDAYAIRFKTEQDDSMMNRDYFLLQLGIQFTVGIPAIGGFGGEGGLSGSTDERSQSPSGHDGVDGVIYQVLGINGPVAFD